MPDDAASSERVRVRVRRRLTESELRARRRRRMRRRLLRIGVVVVIVAVAAGVWMVITGLSARHSLQQARDDLGRARVALSHGDVRAANSAVDKASDETANAKRRTNDVIWRAVAAIPWLGNAAETARGVANQAHTLASVTLPTALQGGNALDPGKARPTPSRIDLQALVQARKPLADSYASARHVRASLAGLPSVGYVSPIHHALAQIRDQTNQLVSLLDRAHKAAELGPPMLGIDGPRRYFVAFQTNAEARGTGGLVGAYAIVRAVHGSVQVEHVGADSELDRDVAPVINLGRAYNDVWGRYGTTDTWGNTNMSPNFPDAAKIWQAWYQKLHPATRIDGSIATDPMALSYILGALGPVTLKSGEHITGNNVVRLLEVDTYARYNNDPARKAFQVSVAEAVLHEFLAVGANPRGLLSALAKSASEGRMLVASAVPAEEAILVTTEVGGSVDQLTGPTAYLVVNNAAGNKLDYYLRRSLTFTGGGCGSVGRRTTVTVELTNGAPAHGLPPIVSGRQDLDPGQPFVRDSSRSLVSLLVTEDAVLTSATIDGQPLSYLSEKMNGHPLFTSDVEIRPGQTMRLVYELSEPVVAGAPRVPVQALVSPMRVSTNLPTCA